MFLSAWVMSASFSVVPVVSSVSVSCGWCRFWSRRWFRPFLLVGVGFGRRAGFVCFFLFRFGRGPFRRFRLLGLVEVLGFGGEKRGGEKSGGEK